VAKLLEIQGSGGGGLQRSKTSIGSILGSPLYMAPEQAEGIPDRIGPQTDIYALGAMLYHMLAGRPPFEAEMMALVLAKHMTDQPEPLTSLGISQAVNDVIAHCMEKKPEDRPRSAGAVAKLFDAAVNNAVIELKSKPDVPLPSPSDSARVVQAVAAQALPTSPRRPPPQMTGPHRPSAIAPAVTGPLPQARRPAVTGPQPPAARGDVTGPHRHQVGDDPLSKEPAFVAQWGNTSTLSGSTGQLGQAEKKGSSGWFAAISLIVLAGLVAGGIVVYQRFVKPAPIVPATILPPTTPPKPPGPKVTPITRHRLLVMSMDKDVVCLMTIDGKDRHMAAPCEAHVDQGKTVTLKISRGSFAPLSFTWPMKAERKLTIELDKKKKKLVVAGGAPPPSAPPIRTINIAKPKPRKTPVRRAKKPTVSTQDALERSFRKLKKLMPKSGKKPPQE